jgi:hypothetical protein
VQPLQDVVPAGDEGRDVCLQVSLQKQAGSIPLQRSSRLRHREDKGGDTYIHLRAVDCGVRRFSVPSGPDKRSTRTPSLVTSPTNALYMRSPVRPPIYAPAKVLDNSCGRSPRAQLCVQRGAGPGRHATNVLTLMK